MRGRAPSDKIYKKHLNSIFPSEERDAQAIERLCTRESLEQADFTLSGMELTLHYRPAPFFPGR